MPNYIFWNHNITFYTQNFKNYDSDEKGLVQHVNVVLT